ncbi:D-alanyl-D-alanine carboxypeptidase [Kamptonema animale CS-326]|jgi:D-alanyl-D-alanine carboxypeptidase/D-alanyl-D-alanine-endopeptidase (penicillin-binding protein 4)|uniref:D-alanyl-D-alanine carboxypeptidase n=1 Tax=Kamptonema animale TaxID=92934 RepID=UPI00232A7C56|nr:D-alanyl-D-alanine carboxypeptidase [Kamptonema animale]MDB9510650.1 D-alanyl-D-alanine carboxypeptidase [Kamptonema animale CS-326]
MLKIRHLTAAISGIVLVIIAGCTANETPKIPSPSPQSDATPASVKKEDKLSIVSPANPDTAANSIIQQYIKKLAAKGVSKEKQGVWIQSKNTLLANHQGTIPLPAASITKVATTLAALQTFGPDRQFVTVINATGPIEKGVLKGDLVIEGDEDPLFIWEEAIALGNTLNQKGIKRITGNLIIIGKFYMNFELDPQKAGSLLKEGLNSQIWSSEAESQYQTLPVATPKPQIIIDGSVKVLPTTPTNIQPLVRHYSLPLAELVKKMNQYSNNLMADMLADTVGGAKVVAEKAAEIAGVPPAEIQLVNGSGLSEENRISPRAACAIFLALERYLQPYNMTIADVLTVVGKDPGILNERKIPPLAVVKSGTLDYVSALGGALPTKKQGTVWFVMMNGGENVEEFRAQQEALLNIFLKEWGSVQVSPPELTPNPSRKSKSSSNEIIP